MMTVELNGIQFFARHGFYPEEQVLGNRFVVDISVDFEPSGDASDDSIGHTVNYEILNVIVNEEMRQTKKLLETVVQAILTRIRQRFPFIQAARVSIKKLNPLIKGEVASSGVTITFNNNTNEL